MNACCNPARRQPSRLRRGGALLAWLLPGTALAFIPKCPACLAAYIALATGIGISIPAASCIRYALGALCIVTLGVSAAMWFLRKLLAKKRPTLLMSS